MTSPSSRRPPRRASRLADEHPAWPASVPDTPAADAPPSPPPAAPAAEPPMPAPRRRRATREQLNTRVRTDIHHRLHRFVEEHDAAVQDVVETALTEYLDRRGG